MKMISKGIRSTRKVPSVVEEDEPEPHPEPITEPTSNIHDVFVHCFENPLYADQNTIRINLPSRYPDTSFKGHKYKYVMHDTITNYINAKGLTSNRAPELIRGFEECYIDPKKQGLITQLVKLDNEISKKMVQLFEAQNLDYQLVTPGDHRLLSAERAIQTFKNYFISICSDMHSHFLKRALHHALYQIVITLNMLQPLYLNPDISAYMQVHGNYNFNKHSLAPVGCKIIIHNQKNKRPPWSDHGSRGFYVGPTIKHYRDSVCFMSETKALRISNTVDFFHTTCTDPTMSATEHLSLIMIDLLEVFKAPLTPSPIFNSQWELATAITTLQSILGRDHTTPTVPPPLPNTPPPTIPVTTNTKTRSAQFRSINLYPIGTIIQKYYAYALSFHEGEITSFDVTNNLYHVKYLQGDREEFIYDEIRKYRKMTQKYTKNIPCRNILHGPSHDFNNSVLYIPTKASPNPVKQDYLRKHLAHLLHQQHNEYVSLRHSVLAGAVWDKDLRKMASYKDLVNHRNSIIQNQWTHGGENKFGCLFQGFSPNGIDGLDVLEWIEK